VGYNFMHRRWSVSQAELIVNGFPEINRLTDGLTESVKRQITQQTGRPTQLTQANVFCVTKNSNSTTKSRFQHIVHCWTRKRVPKRYQRCSCYCYCCCCGCCQP